MPESLDASSGSSDALLVLPLVLDVRTLPIMVAGGNGIVQRLAALDERHAKNVHVFADAASPETARAAGSRLTPRAPQDADFARIRPRLLFVADAAADEEKRLYSLGHEYGALVHVQDKLALCDFHMPAILRRGQLQVAVSTGGAAPGLSRLIRDHLASVLGQEWAERVDVLAAARRQWKAKGASFSELAKSLTDFVAARGWLPRS